MVINDLLINISFYYIINNINCCIIYNIIHYIYAYKRLNIILKAYCVCTCMLSSMIFMSRLSKKLISRIVSF